MVTQEHLSLLAGASRAATREDWEKAAADVLRKSGVTDFSRYAAVPGTPDSALAPDFFLPDNWADLA